MKALTYILIILTLGLTACHPSKKALTTSPVIVTNRDRIRTEYIETVRIDTVIVEVPIPAESVAQEVKDSTSHIETSLAESDAWINEDGTLGHSIKNKPQKINAEVPVPVKETQTNSISNGEREIPVPYPEPVYVERSPTIWEMIRLEAFWYLVAMLGISIVWIFRRPIIIGLRKLF